MAGNIFINYRRDDDAGFTQALYSRLEQAFPSENLFMDVDNIAPGLDFVQVLNDEVARCDVVIAVIGKNWLSVTDETGGRRLDNPEDFVRIEIESALAQKKRVIPVLVNDARMPRSTELPETMRAFARCNAARLTHERFRADMAGLIKSLEQILAEVETARQAEVEAARSEAKAKEKEEAERSRQERLEARKRREGRPAEPSSAKTEPREPPRSVVSWIAGLPSVISWRVPVAMVVIGLLGWFLPGKIFMTRDGLGWGIWSLLYGLVGLIVIGAVLYVRRTSLVGTELALYWLPP
jgi:TIR domain-containing protein